VDKKLKNLKPSPITLAKSSKGKPLKIPHLMIMEYIEKVNNRWNYEMLSK
jgi:hypothetical protein